MKANERYFERLCGTWNWSVQFRLIAFSGLFSSAIRWDHKMRVVGMILSQTLFGPFRMRTEVTIDKSQGLVIHRLELFKFGIVFYRSLKRIFLQENGYDLMLEGEESYWPFMARPQGFRDYRARVDENATAAKYEWPLFGSKVGCETRLAGDEGYILLDAGWLRCRFQMTAESLIALRQRS